MIRQLTIKNFKCLRDVTVALEPFTLFVGPNGSGKTSFLQALDLLCRTFQPATRIPGHRLPEDEIRSNSAYGATDGVELSCLSGELHYRYRTAAQPRPQHPVRQGWAGEGAAFAKGTNPLDWQQWQPQQKVLPNAVWLRLDPNVLRNSQQGQEIRKMENNGQGMHRALSSMLLERRHDFFKLEADLTRIVPAVRQLQPTADHEIRFDMSSGKGLTAQQVSEGTLLTLGLLTAIHAANKPGCLLLDDLDRALHPKAQRELIDLLRGVQKTNPEIQIVGSTHSPYLLGRMEPSEVQVTYLRDDGSTACEPLTHHPKFSKWKEEFHPGEMWSMFGEKWVAESGATAK